MVYEAPASLAHPTRVLFLAILVNFCFLFNLVSVCVNFCHLVCLFVWLTHRLLQPKGTPLESMSSQ